MTRRIGIFGGSFDPFHLGHRQVAQVALDEGGLDHLHVVPARVSPHKQHVPPAPGEERYLMAVLGTLDEPRITVERWELSRHGPSYAYDTVVHVREREGPEAELYWLIGADNVGALMRWHRAEELIAACRFWVVPRAGLAGDALEAAIAGALPAELRERVRPLPMPPVDVSSTELREELQAGASVADRLPRLTALYMERYNLYPAKTADHPCQLPQAERPSKR
ncbi:MAG TPA: nicotinate (nicotinamide) nucleotide adenylyltransferase [Pantanalinema sp.]